MGEVRTILLRVFKIEDKKSWLRVVDDVRTLVMTSQEDILIPKLGEIPGSYV